MVRVVFCTEPLRLLDVNAEVKPREPPPVPPDEPLTKRIAALLPLVPFVHRVGALACGKNRFVPDASSTWLSAATRAPLVPSVMTTARVLCGIIGAVPTPLQNRTVKAPVVKFSTMVIPMQDVVIVTLPVSVPVNRTTRF